MSRGKMGSTLKLDTGINLFNTSKHTDAYSSKNTKYYTVKQTRTQHCSDYTEINKDASSSSEIKVTIYPSEICVKCKGIYSRTTEKLRFFGHRFLRGWKHASLASIVTLIASVFAWMTHIIALTSPYWEYMEDDYGNSYSGLWTVCIMGRCDQFINHPLYGWFHLVQTCMLLSFFTLTAALVTHCVFLFPRGYDVTKRRLIAAVATMCIVTWLLCTVAVVIYGLDQGQDPSSLSWGFAMANVAMLAEFIASIATVVECKRVWQRVDTLEMSILTHVDTPPQERRFLPPRLQRSESMPERHDDDVFSETVPLNNYEVRNRVNSYCATPETPTLNARDRAFSFNVIRERSESMSSIQDPFSRSLNIS